MDSRKKKLTQYVVPTILGNCAYFLFTIIDGIFVGQGVGTDALGAVNLVWPFVMVLNAIIMLTVVGGVTVSAVRIGRGLPSSTAHKPRLRLALAIPIRRCDGRAYRVLPGRSRQTHGSSGRCRASWS